MTREVSYRGGAPRSSGTMTDEGTLNEFLMSSLIALNALTPLHVESCSVSGAVAVPQGDAGSLNYGGYDLRVRFTNTTQDTVSRVTFQLDDGTTVVDAGSFSPNVTIDHIMPIDKTQADSCRVLAVTFSNGLSWNGGF